MKRLFLFGAIATLALGFIACSDEEEDPKVVSINFGTPSYDGNVVTLTATAENAVSYTWDFVNGDIATGTSVETDYNFAGEYWVKCTAAGKLNSYTDSIKINVPSGDPTFINEVTTLLAGTWKWAGTGDTLTDRGLWSCGGKSHVYNEEGAEFDYFDQFDDSWWKLGEYGGVVSDAARDDRYSFAVDKSMAYTNAYDTSGFMMNWAWINKYGFGTPDVWSDEAVLESATKAYWDLLIIEHTSDTIPATIVNGKEVKKSYVINLKGGAFMGVGAYSKDGESNYQICRIDTDTLWVRYDNTYPQDLPIKTEWEAEGIKLGDPEWDYFYLVRAND
jgi:hypothetical protein